jgi:large subunit ribosomal protein L14
MSKVIYKNTRLIIADNSGAKIAQCIQVYKGQACGVGDIIRVCIKKVRPDVRDKFFKKTFLALVVRTVGRDRDSNGIYNSFSDNAAVLLTEKREPMGTSIAGPVSRKVEKVSKAVASMASTRY